MVDYFQSQGHETQVLTSRHGIEGEVEEQGVMRRLMVARHFSLPPYRGFFRIWNGVKTYQTNYRVTAEVLKKFQPDFVFFWSLLRLGLGPVRAVQDLQIPKAFSINDESLAGYMPREYGMVTLPLIESTKPDFILVQSRFLDPRLLHNAEFLSAYRLLFREKEGAISSRSGDLVVYSSVLRNEF